MDLRLEKDKGGSKGKPAPSKPAPSKGGKGK
jgi:hypothetical protein